MIKPLLLGMNRYDPLFWQSHRDHQKPDEYRHVNKINISVMDKKNNDWIPEFGKTHSAYKKTIAILTG